MEITFKQTEEFSTFVAIAEEDEIPAERDDEIAQDEQVYEQLTAAAAAKGFNPVNGVFEAGAIKMLDEGKRWELRFEI